MAKNPIYRITVLKWVEKNPEHKKSYKKTLIANNMIHDSALNALPVSHRWLWVGILLTCGDHSSDTIEITERQLRAMLESSKSVLSALDALKSFQLLTYEVTQSTPYIKELKEKNRIEVKEKKSSEVEKKPPSVDKTLNQVIWASYQQAYVSRYKVEPVRNASVNAKISQLGKRLGTEAVDVVKFYLSHNDSFYLKTLHAIGPCLSNAEALRTQMLRGKAITNQDVRQFEQTQNLQNLIRDIEENGI